MKKYIAEPLAALLRERGRVDQRDIIRAIYGVKPGHKFYSVYVSRVQQIVKLLRNRDALPVKCERQWVARDKYRSFYWLDT